MKTIRKIGLLKIKSFLTHHWIYFTGVLTYFLTQLNKNSDAKNVLWEPYRKIK